MELTRADKITMIRELDALVAATPPGTIDQEYMDRVAEILEQVCPRHHIVVARWNSSVLPDGTLIRVPAIKVCMTCRRTPQGRWG